MNRGLEAGYNAGFAAQQAQHFAGNMQNALAATAPRPIGQLPQMVDELMKILADSHNNANRIESCLARLTNPRPAEAQAGQPPIPNPQSLEGQIAQATSIANALHSRLAMLAEGFDRAL